MLRRIRDLVLASLFGGLLVLGGAALADVPDNGAPSAPNPEQTIYLCYRDSGTPLKAITGVFDRSQGLAQGKPDCRSLLGPGNHTIEVVPDAVRETND